MIHTLDYNLKEYEYLPAVALFLKVLQQKDFFHFPSLCKYTTVQCKYSF